MQRMQNVGNLDNINTALLKGLSRGGWLYPFSDIVNLVIISYLIIHDIATKPEFFFSFSQRLIAFNSFSVIAKHEHEEVSIPSTLPCSNKYEPVTIVKMALYICTDVLLNNLCCKKNDQFMSQKLAKKPKLQTLR